MARFLAFCLLLASLGARAMDCVQEVQRRGLGREHRYVIIVDGFNSGSLYAPELRRLGYHLIHVQGAKTSPAFYWGMEGRFYDAHFYIGRDGDIINLAYFLKGYEVIDVIGGTDRGAPIADKLRIGLGLPGNSQSFSVARHDKIEMGKVLGDVNQYASGELSDLLEWAREWATYPLVMKVPKGVGTFGFHILHSDNDLVHAYASLIGKPDNMGNPVDRVLLQEYLNGTVMAFDTVSGGGGHYVTEILRYKLKKVRLPDGGNSLLYDYADIVDEKDAVVTPLRRYGSEVLEKFGVRYGASHIEIMDLGPGVSKRFRLIEINPRIVGAGIPDLVEASTGRNPISVHIESIHSPHIFSFRAGRMYTRYKAARIVTLASNVEGEIVRNKNIELLKGLASYRSHRIKSSGPIVRTVDLATAPGNVYLCHENQEQIEADTQKIREMNFFVVRP